MSEINNDTPFSVSSSMSSYSATKCYKVHRFVTHLWGKSHFHRSLGEDRISQEGPIAVNEINGY